MAAKFVVTNGSPELCALTRAKQAKLERDKGRAEMLASLKVHNQKNYTKNKGEAKSATKIVL
jgi:hypothetical protein